MKNAAVPSVSLLTLPCVDPTRGRSRLNVAFGMTVGEMVAVALPDLSDTSKPRVRVSVGEDVIAPEIWHRVRPRRGVTVLIRVVPGDDALRSVLQVAVLVAAVALGQFYAPAVAGGLTGLTGYSGFALSGSPISSSGSRFLSCATIPIPMSD